MLGSMKTRKSVKYICMCIAIVLIFSSCFYCGNVMTNTNMVNTNKQVYNYTNKFNYDYTVNLLQNKFIPTSNIKMSDKYFVTDLIDNIDMNLNYSYNGNSESDVSYSYEILGILTTSYTQDGKERKLWDDEEVLKPITSGTVNGKKIDINETLKLDLKEKNKLIREFEDTMGISIAANYVVMLKVNTNTNVKGLEAKNEYKPLVTISLGQKVTTIFGENNLENTEYISKNVVQKEKINAPLVVVNILMFVVGMILFVFSLKFKSINIVRNEYRQELNRILKLCQDKIIQVNENPSLEKENIINVTDFGEIIKVSEELFKPILYWFDEKTEEAQFCVISENVVYKYILKK